MVQLRLIPDRLGGTITAPTPGIKPRKYSESNEGFPVYVHAAINIPKGFSDAKAQGVAAYEQLHCGLVFQRLALVRCGARGPRGFPLVVWNGH